MDSAPRPNTPSAHRPPYDAYEAKYADPRRPIPAAFIGIQCRNGACAAARRSELESLFRQPGGPVLVERGWHEDTPGARTWVFWAYWRSTADLEDWRQQGFGVWLAADGTLAGDIGQFVETALVPPSRLDTLLASDTEYHGIARLSERVEKTWYHGYWGGSRDRILDSAQDPLVNEGLPDASGQPPGGYGETVSVVMPPNVCVARGGPNWSAATGREREIFLDRVYPAFIEGARYLRDNPDEAGCCSASLVQETDAQGKPIERVNLHAYFETLADLERWTRSHPTHLEIFHRYLAMVGELGELPAINLYHEVSVIPEGSLTGTYVNCDPATGFLRFGTGAADRNTN